MLSYEYNIPKILSACKGYNNILDVGPGFGKYGLLLREQHLSAKAAGGDLIPKDDFIIHACELTAYFVNFLQYHKLYDMVHSKSIFDLSINIVNDYNLVLLIDVVEHYPKDVVFKFLQGVTTDVLVSTPKNTVMYTEHFYGDPHHHISQWSKNDFSGWEDHSTELSYIYVRKGSK